MVKNLFVYGLLFLSLFPVFGQTGTIRGSIIEDASGEPLYGVTVVVKGTTTGGITDFEGQFEINTQPGTYELQISFVSFATVTISDVAVKAGEVTNLYEVRMQEEASELEAVVITAEVVRNSESALLTVKKKSANLIDGISSQSFRKIGDSDAAAAAKRVTGVSVEGGKYVYVRGLGDRYTKSMLNNMDIPGLDPDRNTLQMDIFPTNVVDNLTILKSFTPDLPADFTGGIVNIETKDFPEEKILSFSVGYGFNPDMHFNSNFLVYDGSKTDFLGFDNGRRDVPIDKHTEIPHRVLGEQLTTDLTNKFDKTLGADTKTSLGNLSLSFTTGNQYKVAVGKLGYNVSLAYRRQSNFFEHLEYSIYQKPPLSDEDTYTMRIDKSSVGNQGSVESQVSGLLGLAFKTDKSKYKLNYLHILNGVSTASFYRSGAFVNASWRGQRTVLEYNERSIQNLLLSGEHKLSNGWAAGWKVSPTFSSVQDKDIRTTPFQEDEDDPSTLLISPSETGDPNRLWRDLTEFNIGSKVDFTKEFEALAGESKLRFGGGSVLKSREFEIVDYTLNIQNDGSIVYTGDPDELLSEELVWTSQKDIGSWYFGGKDKTNAFEATQMNLSVYVSGEFQVLPRLKSIAGVRMENYSQSYIGIDQQGESFDDEVLSSNKFFPSLNFVFQALENTNLRVAYSRTIARPSFKEASYAQIIDPVTDRTYIGSLRQYSVDGEVVWDGNVKETDIDNIDLRFETFLPAGQTFSVSLFYKRFKNPLELVTFSEGNPDNFQTRNMGDANVYGLELEGRKNLGFLSAALRNLVLNANVSFIKSALEMDKSRNGEYESRLKNAREGEKIHDTRTMSGQAPYIVNAGLNYNMREKGFDAGLYYNVQGKTLSVVGIGAGADVYAQPFHSVNFSVSKKLGKEFNSSVRFRISNLLGDDRERLYESYRSQDGVFDFRSPGRTFSISFRHSF